jgi:hypothetical protein
MSCLPCSANRRGSYDIVCLGCCVRLLQSVGPSELRREAMLEVIRKTPGTPPREAILEKMAELAEAESMKQPT